MFALRPLAAALVLLTAAWAHPAPPTSQPAPVATPAPETKVVTSEPVHALVLPMKGSYQQHPEAFARLSSYLAGKGAAPSAAPFGRYFSDPSQGEDQLVWEVGYAVAGDFKAEPPFEIRDIPASLTAVRLYRGSWEGLTASWPDFLQWVAANGYAPSGPAVQVFRDFLAPEVEMRLPVRKAQ